MNQSEIFDINNNVTNIDKQTLSLLDIIGSAIIDNYYNNLYDKAIHMKEKINKSITDCYRTCIINYVKDNDSPTFYKTLINNIQFYTKISTCYDDIGYIQTVNLYSKLFIPNQYFASMTENQKNNILFMILKETINQFSHNIISNYISMIIDDHNNSENVLFLQNEILKILLQQREKSYSNFIKIEDKKKQKVLVPKSDKKSTQIMLSMSKKYKKCIEDYENLKNNHNLLKQKYQDLSVKSKDMQQLFLSQINNIKKLEKQNKYLKTQLNIFNSRNQYNNISSNEETKSEDEETKSEDEETKSEDEETKSEDEETKSEDEETKSEDEEQKNKYTETYIPEFSFDTTPKYIEDM